MDSSICDAVDPHGLTLEREEFATRSQAIVLYFRRNCNCCFKIRCLYDVSVLYTKPLSHLAKGRTLNDRAKGGERRHAYLRFG